MRVMYCVRTSFAAGGERADAAHRLAHGDPDASRSAAGRLWQRARRIDQLRRRVCTII